MSVTYFTDTNFECEHDCLQIVFRYTYIYMYFCSEALALQKKIGETLNLWMMWGGVAALTLVEMKNKMLCRAHAFQEELKQLLLARGYR